MLACVKPVERPLPDSAVSVVITSLRNMDAALSFPLSCRYYQRFPGDVAQVHRIVRHLQSLPDGCVRLPSLGVLRPRCAPAAKFWGRFCVNCTYWSLCQ